MERGGSRGGGASVGGMSYTHQHPVGPGFLGGSPSINASFSADSQSKAVLRGAQLVRAQILAKHAPAAGKSNVPEAASPAKGVPRDPGRGRQSSAASDPDSREMLEYIHEKHGTQFGAAINNARDLVPSVQNERRRSQNLSVDQAENQEVVLDLSTANVEIRQGSSPAKTPPTTLSSTLVAQPELSDSIRSAEAVVSSQFNVVGDVTSNSMEVAPSPSLLRKLEGLEISAENSPFETSKVEEKKKPWLASLLTGNRSIDKASKTSRPPTAAFTPPKMAPLLIPFPVASKTPAVPIRCLLEKDEAYIHAQSAGKLWQTLVGEFVRFPIHWFPNSSVSAPSSATDFNRIPRMSSHEFDEVSKWMYISRNRVRGNPYLNSVVKNTSNRTRGGGRGRLLLHIVVQDTFSWGATQDIVIGCFHPKHIETVSDDRKVRNAHVVCDEDVREIWMAVRKRRRRVLGSRPEGGTEVGSETRQSPVPLESMDDSTHNISHCGDGGQGGSLIDTILLPRHVTLDQVAKQSPLGERTKINNSNVCAVFGDKPPKETVFIIESHLYDMMCNAKETSTAGTSSPAIVLLQEFLFKRAGKA